MIKISTKQYDELREALVTNLALDFFEDGEIDHILKEIDSYDPQLRQKILALTFVLSHASSSLVPGLLRSIKTASRYLSIDDLHRWVGTAFDLRDSHGMDHSLRFLSKVDMRSLKAFQAEEGFPLREAAPRLETYLRAISGRDFKILPDHDIYTDTVNIYLPHGINRFPGRDDNFALYKLAAIHCWAQIEIGTLSPELDLQMMRARFDNEREHGPGIESFFGLFTELRLALELYTIIESFRAEYFLSKELPGLMKQATAIKNALYEERPVLDALSPKGALVEGLWQYYLTGKTKGSCTGKLTEALASLYGIQYEAGSKKATSLLFDFYDSAVALPGDLAPRPAPLFMPRILPHKITAHVQKLRTARLKKLDAAISKLIEMPDFAPQNDPQKKERPEGHHEPLKDYLLIKGKLVELDEELKSLINQKGGVPGGILVKGSAQGGESALKLTDLIEETDETQTAESGLKYDEWDYNRAGYKKHWCSLYEQDIHAGVEPFVELTLKRYGGSLTALRKKFELLKRDRRLMRRQKDGDDIDFDAVVETFSDMRAGVSPSENLFVRIDRQERDIAVLFLVDMSGSTRGWVNQAEKESLVLMSEALETLGDRYAVYSFSGVTRNRCDLYRIKAFGEPYSDTVKQRIAGIEPKDYTRMGPFVRHAAALLKKVDARMRLLITLSDSKPEDWDGYKGDYAIEDTRKALIEASGQAIYPFCITIDREAQSYLPHLFGKGNYIFIDDVRKLPARITEIYRKLTT